MAETAFGIIVNSIGTLKRLLVGSETGLEFKNVQEPDARKSVQYDEVQYHPFTTTDLTGNKVLLLSPHPDDESLTSGGALALHVLKGDPVKVVFLTDGAKADTQAEYVPDEYVKLRRSEAEEATTVLGVTDIEFWDIPDRELAESSAALDRLCKVLKKFKPTLVYAPSPLEFHPDHRAAAHLIWQAVQRTGTNCRVAFFDYNRPININTLVDISSVVEIKRKASNCYQSQLKYYPYADCAISFNHYRSLTVAATCQYAEGYFIVEPGEIWSKPIETVTVKQFLPNRPHHDFPLVSIVIRTHNRPILLREAISSVLTQTYSNIEIVVVNDGGDDVTQIVDDFASYVSIKQVRHEEPRGRAAAANTGMQAARGKFVNFLDDDDVLYAQHVEKLAKYLETTGEQFAYSDCEKCDYQWLNNNWIAVEEKRLFFGVDFDRDRLSENNYIPLICAMFRRDLFLRAGPFDESLEYLEDWDLFLRMARSANFHRLPGVTAEYRRFSQNSYDNKFWTLKIYQKYRESLDPELLAKHNL